MRSKNILPALVLLGLIAGAATVFGGEANSHDHQQTKTHITSSDNTKKATDHDCTKAQEAEVNAEISNADSSSEESVPCETKTKKQPRHDHRKSKNL